MSQPQEWKNVVFVVEVRPDVPKVGMNEFIAIATEHSGKPGYYFVISFKMQNGKRWAQAIQDGRSGAYRRAVLVKDPENDVLMVQVRNKDQQHVLQFPLNDFKQKN